MKIHIVQKGDTLWEISKKYGVDFEQLKQANSHIASPDMIMPGMKIKVPSTTKNVKKEGIKKEAKKETQQPYKDVSPKPMPVIEEDDKEKQKVVKPEMPVPPMPEKPSQPILQMPIMQMPVLDQDFEFNFPAMPSYPEKKEEKVKEEKKVVEQKPVHQPPVQEQPVYQPPVQEPMAPVMHHPIPYYPCCYYVHPCFPPFPYPPMVMPDYTQHSYQMSPVSGDCGCGAPKPVGTYPMDGMGFYPPSNQPSFMNPSMAGPMFEEQGQTPTPPVYPDFSSMNRKDNDDNDDNDIKE